MRFKNDTRFKNLKVRMVKLFFISFLVSRNPEKNQHDSHKELFTRRRLVDLAKSQAQDLAILREELERLRLRTYPAFRSN